MRFQWGTKAKPCRLLIRIRVMRGYRDILGQKIPRVVTQKIRLITRSVQAGNKVVAYAIVAIFLAAIKIPEFRRLTPFWHSRLGSTIVSYLRDPVQ